MHRELGAIDFGTSTPAHQPLNHKACFETPSKVIGILWILGWWKKKVIRSQGQQAQCVLCNTVEVVLAQVQTYTIDTGSIGLGRGSHQNSNW